MPIDSNVICMFIYFTYHLHFVSTVFVLISCELCLPDLDIMKQRKVQRLFPGKTYQTNNSLKNTVPNTKYTYQRKSYTNTACLTGRKIPWHFKLTHSTSCWSGGQITAALRSVGFVTLYL